MNCLCEGGHLPKRLTDKILVVDDNADSRKLMRILLEMYDYTVVEAANGYEAVEKAVNERPDLIFMDIAMPVLDGIKATAAIREHEGLAHVPIVIITGHEEFYRDQATAAGCTEVIRKPFDLDGLRPLVRYYIPDTPSIPTDNLPTKA